MELLHQLVACLLLLLLSWTGAQESICNSLAFRRLTVPLQNEHQCMVLEKLQDDFGQDKRIRDSQSNEIIGMLQMLERRVKTGFKRTAVTSSSSSIDQTSGTAKNNKFPGLKGIPIGRDCYELFNGGIDISGVYPIQLDGGSVVVWCDMDTDGGGWTVLQRRTDGSINFTRDWNDYAFGFGNTNTEYWLGNENIHELTTKAPYTLRVDLWDWEGGHAVAYFDKFKVASEEEGYKLTAQGYHGDAGDAFNFYHNDMKFSTYDKDQDNWYGNCAQKDQSGWWFRACGFSSLNGMYYQGGQANLAPDGLITGITWYHWKNDYSYSMKRVEMKIKPKVALSTEEEDREYAEGENDLDDSTSLGPMPIG